MAALVTELLTDTHARCRLADRSINAWSTASAALRFHEEMFFIFSRIDRYSLIKCQQLVREGDCVDCSSRYRKC